MLDEAQFRLIVDAVVAAGFGEEDIAWSESVSAPEDAQSFALEAAFVICNSGMKNTIARAIFGRVREALLRGESANTVFGHRGKATAIDTIWSSREELYRDFHAAPDKLEFCSTLPWIGPVTKFHLAKNFGVDVAKPDVHLQRLADRESTSVHELCVRVAAASGYRIATVDLLLWRACVIGVLNSRTGAIDVSVGAASTPAPDLFSR